MEEKNIAEDIDSQKTEQKPKKPKKKKGKPSLVGKGLASDIFGELKLQNTRLFVALIMVIICWIGTIAGFMLYLNQYDFTGKIEQTGVYTFSDSEGNVISSDIDAEQMKEILRIINGTD